jgi:hypothetical protein
MLLPLRWTFYQGAGVVVLPDHVSASLDVSARIAVLHVGGACLTSAECVAARAASLDIATARLGSIDVSGARLATLEED